MAWPEATDYNEAIQNPAVCFADPDLRQGRPEVNALGWPLPCSGNFAAVYKVFGPDETAWAVKCFTRAVPGLRERYYAISAHLREARLPFAVDFQYLEQGIRIHGDWYAVVKMRWVEGFTLNEFLKDHADKPQILERLAALWLKLARELRRANIAHADLQHGNVLLVPGGKSGVLGVRLIDYDGMFVPALARSGSGEVGHANYQHPDRARLGIYDAEVDRFPHLVIYTALHALLGGGRALWDRYDNGENLLFRAQDFHDPASSPLFRELWLMPDPVLRSLTTELARACQGSIGEVPLLEEIVKDDYGSTPAAPADSMNLRPPEPRLVEPAWWVTAPPAVRGDRPSHPEEPPTPGVTRGLRKGAIVLGCVALAISSLCIVVSWLGRPSALPQIAEEARAPLHPAHRPAAQPQGNAADEPAAKATAEEQAPLHEFAPDPEEASATEAWLAEQARLRKAAEEKRHEAEAQRDREQKEAARRTLAAALKRQQEEARQKAQQEAVERQREAAERAAQAAALQSRKEEAEASRKLKLARSFIRDSMEQERKNEPDYAQRLLAIAHKRLREIIQLYPSTRAAAECRKLLEGREEPP